MANFTSKRAARRVRSLSRRVRWHLVAWVLLTFLLWYTTFFSSYWLDPVEW